ncbi:MAG: peptidoglycan editing factor PgeF [Alphaproteobacteria bacterium]|nr:peptidoglycan editing factor PgeF [Alphaproteobacteria bacterium]
MPSPLTSETLSELPGIRHGFFTRNGGVSDGIYASLNCGLGSKDNAEAVKRNRARVALQLSSPQPIVLTPYQVHSATALIVDQPFTPGPPPRGDALVTNTPGLAIGILTADCGPVLLADPVARVVAAAHAGWRGAVGGILEATLAKMVELGAKPARVCASLGPCINQQNYEVGPEFLDDFTAREPSNRRFFTTPDGAAKPHFDLPAFIAARLEGLGIANFDLNAPCTYDNESKFFSFRRSTHSSEPDYGRQISAILVT